MLMKPEFYFIIVKSIANNFYGCNYFLNTSTIGKQLKSKKRIPVLNGRKILSFNNRRSFLPVSMAVSTNKIDPGVAFVVNNMDLILL